MRKRLTKTLVDLLEPREREFAVYDDLVPRLCMRVLPSGSRTYWLRLRQGGRQRWVKIGRYPWDIPTPEVARDEAARLLGLKAAGHDVTLERERARRALTVREFAKRFMHSHAKARMKPPARKADTSLAQDSGRIMCSLHAGKCWQRGLDPSTSSE